MCPGNIRFARTDNLLCMGLRRDQQWRHQRQQTLRDAALHDKPPEDRFVGRLVSAATTAPALHVPQLWAPLPGEKQGPLAAQFGHRARLTPPDGLVNRKYL